MKRLRRVLLTNDDGLTSPGLTALAGELLKSGRYELRVAAPEREQSGVGHCITLHEPLYVERAQLPPPLENIPVFRVAGTPADCVKIAITNLFPDFQPELVVSGINRGPNVGVNVLYSGTVAGALEACLNGIPGAALSLDIPPDGLWHFALAAELAVPLLDHILAHGMPPWTAININFPNRPQKDIKGLRLARHGLSGFKEYYIEEQAEHSRRRFRLEGDMIFRDQDQHVDALALREGWITVTSLGVCLESPEGQRRLKGWERIQPANG